MSNPVLEKNFGPEKEAVVTQAKEWYSKSAGVVFTDYRGLSVKSMQTLRADLAKKGGEIHVIKNTLFRIAAGSEVIDQLPYEAHNGPTAVAFIYENESECCKVLSDFATSSKTLKIKGGYVGGKVLTTKDVEALAKLPPRDVLIAQVIGAIAAPLTSLVGVIEALYADPIRVIGAVADKVGEGSPAPAPTPAPAPEPTASEEPTPAEAEPVADAAPEAPAEEAAPAAEAEAPAEEAATGEEKSE
jgi:large subunit ribosomal protein L10